MAEDMFSAIQAATDATNQFNAEQAQISRDWQEYMSNTAHRREAADLAAAGLNPILSARQGASTPSGATATGESSAGALSGLFSQVLATQSAQAIAERNNAAARLLEEMRESHDLYIHQHFPSNAYQAVSALIDAFTGGDPLGKAQAAARGIKKGAQFGVRWLLPSASAVGRAAIEGMFSSRDGKY